MLNTRVGFLLHCPIINKIAQVANNAINKLLTPIFDNSREFS
ncbi:hypothetical protein THERMOS_377 [Bathymodiolus thermophilus thioautotrophic gill symbiont]|uniref:Uncharacterized protein n=1 Tax=Bathymodiolus thermophilus thioautotrophic gill symbiont TaxID=2360 RepID=A0A8H8XBF6_9GAMM|nr:hypothetical protein THERMOS_377 [Bathymodiolus thermophilus thioautotrophic gill symbiont]